MEETKEAKRPERISADVGQRTNTWWSLVLTLLFLIVATWAAWGSQTALWYDESNYLLLAASIKEHGVPIWFWDPTQPSLFLDSPAGLLYLLSLLPTDVIYEPVLVRSVYMATFGIWGLVAVAIYLRHLPNRLATTAAVAAFLACTGYFTMELVQVRMDLPLATLSMMVIVTVAEIERQSLTAEKWSFQRLLASWMLLLALSVSAFLIKYQAICISGAVGLWMLATVLDRRPAILTFLIHLAGIVAAVAIQLLIASRFGADSGGTLASNLSYNFGRIFASSGGGFDPLGMGNAAVRVASLVAVPLVLYVLARATAPDETRNDPLLNLSVYLAVVVAAFNIVMYRMPGTYTYYMIQAALPLAYIAARSVTILAVSPARTVAPTIVGALLTLITTFQFGIVAPQRWGAGLPMLVEGVVEADQARHLAQELSATLGPYEVVMLDNWQGQGREIPYWMRRTDRYGYLGDTSPEVASMLLGRTGADRVAYLVFRNADFLKQLDQPEWQSAKALVGEQYELVPFSAAPDWSVYRRRP